MEWGWKLVDPDGVLSSQSRQNGELQVERLASEKEGEKRKEGRKMEK